MKKENVQDDNKLEKLVLELTSAQTVIIELQ